MRRRVGIVASLLIASMTFVAGCGSSQPAAPAAPAGGSQPAAGQPAAKPAETKPIKIGQLIPVTGDHAESGKYQKQGAELALEQINKAGGVKGRQLQLVQEDDKSTNPGAVAALQKLLEDKEIPAVVSSIRSTQIQAMMPTINEAKLPIMIGGTNYGLTNSGSQWVFRFRPHDGFSAAVMIKFLVEEQKLKKVAVVSTSDAFGNGGRDFVLENLKKYNMEPALVKGFNPGEKDFTAIVTAIKQSGADSLVTYFTSSVDLGVFAKQLKQLGASVTWIGSPSITAKDGINLAGDALNGTFGITDFHTEGNPKAKEFTAAYKAKYGQDPDLYSAWTYDAILVLAEAMKKAPDLKPESVRSAILGIKGFMGAENEYNFLPTGDGLDHYYIVKNEGGNIKLSQTLHVGKK